jgi:superfamily I DNA/RNA helicase
MTTPASLPAARTWSTFQTAIFRFFTDCTGNGVVEAVAGSGKTTTIIEGIRRWKAANPTGRAIFVAFNKGIAVELQAKVPAGVDASTLHSAGYKALLRTFKGIKVDDRKAFGYAETVAVPAAEGMREVQRGIEEDLNRAYSLLKATMTNLDDGAACEETLAAYGIELKYAMLSLPLLPAFDTLMRRDTTRCSFDEMLSFVVDHGLPMQQYDLVCVDEAQDMNLLQIELLKRMVKIGGRICAVGDTNQSIYAFRGADTEAMNRIRAEFKVPAQNELPLSITYRCPRLIVKEAQQYVPHIQAADGAAEGAIVSNDGKDLDRTLLEMGDHDMGVCRTNGPLVTCALRLIKQGRKACVRGRDIGKGLSKLVRDLKHKGQINRLIEEVEAWREREVQRFVAAKKQSQAQNATDRADTIIALCEGAQTVAEVEHRIETIFSDTKFGVQFSSIHKSKGLEADKVVWINPGISDFFITKAEENGNAAAAQQERNLCYVAITRAKQTLVYQPLPRPKKEEEG